MTKILGFTMGLLLCALVALGWATERVDHFRTTDRNDVIVFADGTQLWRAEELHVEHLQEGVKIKLAYEERDGRHVVTSLEAAE